MFCHQCGKELFKDACFCSNCGTPVPTSQAAANSAGITAPALQAAANSAGMATSAPQATDDPVGMAAPASQAAADSAGITAPASQAAADSAGITAPASQAAADSAGITAPASQAAANSDGTAEPASQKSLHDEIPSDFIPKKGRIYATGSELYLYRKHYTRKPGKKKFQEEKKLSVIPFDSIIGTTREHYKYGGRLFLSLLLLVCFAAEAFLSVRHGCNTYNALHTPYRDNELAAQESIMAIIDNDGDGQLRQCRNDQKKNRTDADALSAKLAELEAQQTQEILTAVYNSDRFDPDAFFNRELFFHAYQDYLQDLLDIFKSDELLHSWLYSYYKTAKEYGGNHFLDTDMWIYSGSGENGFSSTLDSAASLMKNQYDLDLYEHILYTGRIYITGADFLQKILSLPRYTVDGAIFVKAHGGTPDTAGMSVPGWSKSHYEEFWLYGADYYGRNTPAWLDYGFQAEDFRLDWNNLINETACYSAYKNFMDKIAPDLPRYEMAVYHADNMAYGGIGYSIGGTEASFSDIIASYAEAHPEFIDELRENKFYGKKLTTSVDEEIARTESRLEKLEKEYLTLQEQEQELAHILENADIHRSNYALLLADISKHTQELISFLLFFSSIALLCMLNALICLCRFFDLLKYPRHLFIISSREMDFAFSTGPYTEEQLAALQDRLSSQGNDKENNP